MLHGEVDREVIPFDDIPDHVVHAALAAEDRRFYEHDGYDALAIARALFANLRAGEVEEGASTITQQVAQQAFLGREQTVERKTEEIAYAVALEEHLPKDEILERYLNEVYFGAGAYGVAAAAEQFFRADPEDLTVEQAALLAGLIRAPERLNPRDEPALAEARRNQVLAGMVALEAIDEGEAQRASAEPIDVEPPLERDPEAPYALEAVKREFAQLEELGDDPDERFEQLFGGGLVIHTTLDRRLQGFADEVVAEAFADDDDITGALVALDPRSGAIRALHGGADFDETQFDLATQGRRQPGSALKPFIAAAALADGLAPEAAFEGDGPLAFTLPDEDEPWEVDNFGGARLGTISLDEATASSVNTAFAQLALAVGVDEAVGLADTLGIAAEAAFGPSESWGPSIALGGLTHGVTPLELAAAYGAFADHGRLGPPFVIERVEDAAGEVVYEREPTERAVVLDDSVNTRIVELLEGVVAHGTGTAAQLEGWEVIGKTGTTDDYTDAWFVGATRLLSTAVWVGHPDAQVEMPDMTGGGLPAQLWQQFMSAALDGHEPEPIPREGAALPEPSSATVPDLTGMPVGQALVVAAEAGLTLVLADGDGADPARPVVRHEPGPGASVPAGTPIVGSFSEPAPPPEPEEPAEPEEPDEPDDPDESEDDDEGGGDDEDDGPPPDPPGHDD